MSIFDIIGPVMVGPSSSHTAGAVKIGFITSELLQEEPVHATIILHGSFSATGQGHGTPKALLAGLLGMKPDDDRIPQSDIIAKEHGFQYQFEHKTILNAHPNTALIDIAGKGGAKLKVQGSSLGGGQIMITQIDGIKVQFSCNQNTLVIHNMDNPGLIANVTSILSKNSINIAAIQLFRSNKGGVAVMVIETDGDVPDELVSQISYLEGIVKVSSLKSNTL